MRIDSTCRRYLKYPKRRVLPGAERHSVLIRAPVTSVRHFEQIPVHLKDFSGCLNPIEDKVIVYNFLTEISQGEVTDSNHDLCNTHLIQNYQRKLKITVLKQTLTVTFMFFFFSSSMYSICFLNSSRSWFSIVLATRT